MIHRTKITYLAARSMSLICAVGAPFLPPPVSPLNKTW